MAVQPDNHTIWNLTREQWFQAVCFSLCFLAFMLAEAAVNTRAAVLLGPERVNVVYALGLVCTGLGFLSFALLRKLIRGGSGGGNTPPSWRGRCAWFPPSCS